MLPFFNFFKIDLLKGKQWIKYRRFFIEEMSLYLFDTFDRNFGHQLGIKVKF